jgi:hypothetical protein
VSLSDTGGELQKGSQRIPSSKQGDQWILACGDPEATAKLVKSTSSSTASLFTWHKRLGHPAWRKIRDMSNGGLGITVSNPWDEPGHCETCDTVKSERQPLPKGSEKPKAPLQRVSMDLAGPFPPDRNGNAYFLGVWDHFSRYGHVYLLPNKSGETVFRCFTNFQAFLGNQTGCTVKEVLFDNGTEFVNQHLIDFLDQEGIKVLKSLPYTSPQNGVSERKNRTLKSYATRSAFGAGRL